MENELRAEKDCICDFWRHVLAETDGRADSKSNNGPILNSLEQGFQVGAALRLLCTGQC